MASCSPRRRPTAWPWTAGRFTPYGDDPRTVRVGTADGVERALVLAGELGFTVAGRELTLQVAEQADGRLWAVFADTTSGVTSVRFRFLYSAAPAADGSATVDFNRAQLPQCVFARPLHLPFPAAGQHAGPRGRGGGAEPRLTLSRELRQALNSPGPRRDHPKTAWFEHCRTAKRHPCGYRSFARILPLSACQGHCVSEIRAPPLAAPHGPRPHAGPRLPLGGNEK